MSDLRELLELAAKAAGILGQWSERGQCIHVTTCAGMTDYYWRPHLDDGDSRRLAVKLRMCVSVEHDAQAAFWRGDSLETFNEPMGDDECAAVRLAVLRAAAEVGRVMR